MRSLRADGIPAVISGAGPTVLAFSSPGDTELVARTPAGWVCHELDVDAAGVLVGE
jgi:homoserine kinase